MKINYTRFAHARKQLNSRLKKFRTRGFAIGLIASFTVALSFPAAAQAQTPPTALNDTQALLLLQALAKGQGTGAAALSAAQMQMLSQYLQRESQSAPVNNGIDLAQAQALLARSQGAVALAAQPGAANSTSVSSDSAVPQKKPGVLRIGVVRPKAQMGQGNSGADVADPLRATIIQYLSGPAFDVVPIGAMIPAQIEAETKQKECDYVLYSSISQKMNTGGFGMLRKAMPMASMIPMVGMATGVAGMVASSAAGAAMSGAGGLAGSVKAKSEVTFQYNLTTPGNSASVLTKSATAKAKQDGEDIVTPLIEQAATAVLAELGKKR